LYEATAVIVDSVLTLAKVQIYLTEDCRCSNPDMNIDFIELVNSYKETIVSHIQNSMNLDYTFVASKDKFIIMEICP